MSKPQKWSAALIAVGALTLAGCAGYGDRDPYYARGPVVTDVGVTYIQTAPPYPRQVIIPRRPSVTSVWIDGYWNWTGVQFVWIDGTWDRNPPRAGATWAPGQWTQTKRGWYRRPGRWR